MASQSNNNGVNMTGYFYIREWSAQLLLIYFVWLLREHNSRPGVTPVQTHVAASLIQSDVQGAETLPNHFHSVCVFTRRPHYVPPQTNLQGVEVGDKTFQQWRLNASYKCMFHATIQTSIYLFTALTKKDI